MKPLPMLVLILLCSIGTASADCGEKHTMKVQTENGLVLGRVAYYDNPECAETVLLLQENKADDFFTKLRKYQEDYVKKVKTNDVHA
jgi:hypothetical protein